MLSDLSCFDESTARGSADVTTNMQNPLQEEDYLASEFSHKTLQTILDTNPDSLTDLDLLEVFLQETPGDSRQLLARRLLSQFGSFAAVVAARPFALLAIDGVSDSSAALLKMIHAAAVRLARAEVDNLPVLSNWDNLMRYLHVVLAREPIEQFRVLFLNSRFCLLADEMLSRGTVNHTPAYPREVVKRALELHATALILVHNHPSGDPSASDDDVLMTSAIKMVMDVLSLRLLDHVIIGNGAWLSMRMEGMME